MQKPPAGDDSVGRMQFLLSLRQRGIMDAAVLRALDEVPREHFVEGPFAESAYADQALPINCGQTISQPYVVAYMTEQLDVKPPHRVLEVGTGSGYQAAVLRGSRAGGQRRALSHAGGGGAGRLKTLGYDNVEVVVGRRPRRRPAGALRSHHRHGGGGNRPAALARSLRWAVLWSCRSGRMPARSVWSN